MASWFCYTLSLQLILGKVRMQNLILPDGVSVLIVLSLELRWMPLLIVPLNEEISFDLRPV